MGRRDEKKWAGRADEPSRLSVFGDAADSEGGRQRGAIVVHCAARGGLRHAALFNYVQPAKQADRAACRPRGGELICSLYGFRTWPLLLVSQGHVLSARVLPAAALCLTNLLL